MVDKSLDGSLFIAYIGLAYNILTPAKSISKASYAVKNGLAAAERVFEILEVENTITDKPNAIVKDSVQPNGFLGWVQGTGKEPKDGQPLSVSKEPDFEDYGLGCLLLAGSEVYKLK